MYAKCEIQRLREQLRERDNYISALRRSVEHYEATGILKAQDQIRDLRKEVEFQNSCIDGWRDEFARIQKGPTL